MTFQCLEDEASLVAQLVKNQPAMQGVRSLSSIPESGRSPGEGKGYPLQYSGLEDSVDCIVHGVKKSQKRQSDFHFQRMKGNPKPECEVQSPGLHGLTFRKQTHGSLNGGTPWRWVSLCRTHGDGCLHAGPM